MGFTSYGNVPLVAGLFYSIKPAVTAIVLFAAWRIGSRALKNAVLWTLSLAAFVAIFAFNVPFPYIVLGAGIIGYVGGRVAPDKFRTGDHGATQKRYGAALIDDTTPTPRTPFPPGTKLFLAIFSRSGSQRSARSSFFGWESRRANGLVLH